MVLRFFMLAVAFFFMSCTDIVRNNPDDPYNKDKASNQLSSSSAVEPGYSSVDVPLSSVTVSSSSFLISDDSPPELVNSYNTISPFDTLVVKFKSELVDIDKLNESNIILSRGKLIKGKATTGKELYFIGTNTTPGGLNYFEGGASDSIVFKNLKNVDGYVKNRTVFYFYTYPILDNEPNNREEHANDIELIGDLRKGNGVVFAGVLDHKVGVTDVGIDIYDMEDYYTLKLKARDSVSITVINQEDLSLIINGPSGTAFQATKGKSNVFQYIVGFDYLLENPTLSINYPISVYIKVVDNDTSKPPNPYNINIKVK
ncbi:MAG: hypothetical protein FWF63_04550 [Fibromonadales bacterium]|nr:hypothetical protein [Fibromonadales bacterium]